MHKLGVMDVAGNLHLSGLRPQHWWRGSGAVYAASDKANLPLSPRASHFSSARGDTRAAAVVDTRRLLGASGMGESKIKRASGRRAGRAADERNSRAAMRLLQSTKLSC